MKKLILLLLPLWSIAQTTTGQEQEFDYGIKNNSAQTVTSPNFLTTTGTDGTQGKILPANLPVSTQTQIAIDGKVSDTIRNGINSIAPSENAVYDALQDIDLQSSYDKGNTITTSTGLGAVTVQEGTGNDANNVLVVKNNAGTTTFSVSGAGVINASNKQNSLAVDGTGVKFPTVDAVNNVLALKANDADVVHKTGNETKIGTLSLITPNIASGTTALNAITPLVVTGGNGGGNTNTTGTVVAGNAMAINIKAGNGGNVFGVTGTGLSGNGGDISILAGDGGVATGTGTLFPGRGGDAILQAGTSYLNPGSAQLKAGNNSSALGFGGSVYLTAGWGNNSPTDNNLYNGSIFLGTSASYVVRGNTIIGSVTDDRIHRLQVAGNSIFNGTVKANPATLSNEVVVKSQLDSKITQTITNGVTDKSPSEDAVYDALQEIDLQSSYDKGNTITTTALGAVTVQEGTGNDANNIYVGKNNAGTTKFSVTGAGDVIGGTYNGYVPANDSNVVKVTGNQNIDGTKNFKQRIGFFRSLDNTPAASIGYEDTGFNFSINAGGGSSYVSFKNAGIEVGRFNSATGGLLVNKTLGTVGYKFEVDGKGAFSGNLNAKNFTDLAAKRWVIFGDSFSNDLVNDYVGTVKDNLDMTAVTYAVSGDVSSGQLAVLKAQILANAAFLNNFDIISLHIGVNDQSNGTIPLGSVNSVIGDGSVSANIKEFIQVALTANPIIKIFIITPPEADGGTSGRTYKSHVGFGGWSLEMLSSTISSICKYYSVQCVDLYSLSQFNLQTIPTLTSDGIHPSFPVGTKWVGDIVSRAFTSNNAAGISVFSNEATTGYVPKITTNSTFSNSNLFYNGANLGLGTVTASTPLDVNGIINTNFRYVLNNGVQTNQMFAGGTVFVGGVASDMGLRNDSGKIFLAAGSSTPQFTLNTSGAATFASTVTASSYTGGAILTGTPTAPTAAAGTNTTQIATTAFVQAQASGGNYTPTLTNTANITTSSLTNATYTRIGDIVTVNIGFSVAPTAANTNTVLTITLPIARTVSNVLNSGSGAIFQSNTRLPASFQTSGNTTQGVIYLYPSSTGTYAGSVTFQYNIN